MMIKPLLVAAMALSLSLAAGCSHHKHGDKACCGKDGACCVDKKQCPADCDKACCADKGEANAGEAKTCPAGCTKACCADKAEAE